MLPDLKLKVFSYILVASQHPNTVYMEKVQLYVSCCHYIHTLVQKVLYLDVYSIADQQIEFK